MTRILHRLLACMVMLLSYLSATSVAISKYEWQNQLTGKHISTVHAILQDSRGMIWLGTTDGLFCYDGYSVRRFAIPSQTHNPDIRGMVEHDGQLYLATDIGLITFDPLEQQYRSAKHAPSQSINVITTSGDNLLLGTNNGLLRYTPQSGKCTKIANQLPHPSVSALYRCKGGKIWIGTYGGLVRYDTENQKLTPTPLGTSSQQPTVTDIIQSPVQGTILVATTSGIYKVEPGSRKATLIKETEGINVNCMDTTPGGDIIVGTSKGLDVISNNTLHVYRHDSRQPNTIGNDIIHTLMTDNAGNLWLGTETGITVGHDNPYVRVIHLSDLTDAGEGNQFHAINRDRNGVLWMGGTNGLLQFSDITQGTRSPRHWFTDTRIRCVTETANGDVWMGTDRGLLRFSPNANTFEEFEVYTENNTHLTSWINDMAEGNDHSLWVAFNIGGLVKIDRVETAGNNSRITGKAYPGTTNRVTRIIIGPMGNKWTISERDSVVTRYDDKTGKIKRIGIRSLLGENPEAMTVDADGNVWVAAGTGVVKINQNGDILASVPFKYYTDHNANVLAMTSVGNDLWISTIGAVWAVDKKTLKARILPLPDKNYTAIFHDTATHNILLGANDEIIIAREGFDAIDRSPQGVFVVAIGVGSTILSIPFKQLNKGEVIKLGKKVPEVEIALSTFDYTPHSGCRFAYSLDGANPVILPEGQNIIRLPGLASGRHTLKIKTMGIPRHERTVLLEVASPWYMTTPAFIIFTLLFVGILWLAWYLIRRQRLARERDLKHRETLRMARERSAFLTNMGHELKTPLTMIIGPLDIARNAATDPTTMRASIETAHEHALKLKFLINRVLKGREIDLARDNNPICQCVNLSTFCNEIVNAFAQSFPEMTFRFIDRLGKDNIVEFDVIKMDSILNNLIANACKFTSEKGNVTVTLSADDNNSVNITVADDGCGIPSDKHDLIFTRLFTAAENADGNGIGLYLVKKYVDLHGGTVTLQSEPKQGARITITIPRKQENCTLIPHTSHNPSDRPSMPRVLLVEDDRALASFLYDFLSPDFNVTVAHNGRHGLAKAVQTPPDIIITDEMMPEMSGLEMCRKIKEIRTLANIPIVMLTSHTTIAIEQESISAGIDIFMSKPFEPTLLRNRLCQMLATRKATDSAARINGHTTKKEDAQDAAPSWDEITMEKITAAIEEHLDAPNLNISLLAEKVGMHTKNLYRTVKRCVGIGPGDYIRQVRLRRAAELLEGGKYPVSQVMYMTGYNSSSYFSRCFKAEYGCTPGQYATRQNAGKTEPQVSK